MRRMPYFLSQSMSNKRLILSPLEMGTNTVLRHPSPTPHPQLLVYPQLQECLTSVKGQSERTDCDLVTQQKERSFYQQKDWLSLHKTSQILFPQNKSSKVFYDHVQAFAPKWNHSLKDVKDLPLGQTTFLTQSSQCSQWNDFSSGHSHLYLNVLVSCGVVFILVWETPKICPLLSVFPKYHIRRLYPTES